MPTKENKDENESTEKEKQTPTQSNAVASNDEKAVPDEAADKQATDDDLVKQQPDQESLILSIDNLFVHADKESVTVGDIVRSLEAEYDVKFEKPARAMVRSHLTDLMKGAVEPTVPEVESEQESVSGDFESESSEYEDEEEKEKKPRRCTKKSKSGQTKRTSSRRAARKKPSHVRIHAEMLRKRRIEELRVRNEELQVKQSKEDQQRAEQIAAKFETNTQELRLKRLEDRLDLLQKLDQRRIRVISIESEANETPLDKATTEDQMEIKSSVAATEDSDSDDEFELEIIGKDESSAFSQQAPTIISKVASSGSQLPTKSLAISMLDMVCKLKPCERNKKAKRDGSLSLTADKPQSSPGKSMTARATLRNALLAKQRKAGNMWLARELGYKTEEDHLKDCIFVESKKREEIVRKEEERLRANERKQLRERMLTETDTYEAEDEDLGDRQGNGEGSHSDADGGDEEDEEMLLAREIEEEQRDEEDAPEESSDMPTRADDSLERVEEEHQT